LNVRAYQNLPSMLKSDQVSSPFSERRRAFGIAFLGEANAKRRCYL
jgi:hypothetical protein